MRANSRPGLGSCLAFLLSAALLGSACTPADPLEAIRSQHAQGNFRPTVDELRRIVDESPGDPETNLLLGRALLRTGESGSAIWPLRVAVAEPSLAVEAGLLLTEAALDSRFKNEAIASADAVLAIEPDNLAALEMRVDAYQDTGRNKEVLVEVARVLELDPDNKKVLVPRIVAHLAQREEEEAEAALLFAQDALKQDPEEEGAEPALESARARLCVVTGMFSFERGEPIAADAQFAKCLQDYPSEPLVIQESVAYYDSTARRDQATEILQAAFAAEGTSRFRILLAQRMKSLDRIEEAEQLFREETEENPSPNAWFVLGDHYVRRDMLSEAVDAFQQAVEAVPNPAPMVVFAHADTLIQAGRLEEARAAAQPLQGTSLADLIEGRVLAAEERWEEALATFEKGIRLWPNNAAARFLAGQVAEKLGRFDEAISHYRESIRADKSQSDASFHLALLLEAQGQELQALERIGHYVRARADDPEGYAVSIRLAHRAGQREIARQGLSRLARLPGQKGQALAISARIAGQQRGVQESIAVIQGAPLDLTDPENTQALNVWVAAQLQMNEFDEAQALVVRALEAHPECADFHALLGNIQEQREAKPEQVAAPYRRALELDPDNTDALNGLAALEAEAGNIAAALELYDRASASDPLQANAGIAALALMEAHASLEERKAMGERLLMRHLHSAALASQVARIEAERGQAPARALELARRAARFDRGRRQATLAAFEAVAATGADPQAEIARSALEALAERSERRGRAAKPTAKSAAEPTEPEDAVTGSN